MNQGADDFLYYLLNTAAGGFQSKIEKRQQAEAAALQKQNAMDMAREEAGYKYEKDLALQSAKYQQELPGKNIADRISNINNYLQSNPDLPYGMREQAEQELQ